VASRWVTFTTGLILVVLGLIFAGGLEVLGRVSWTQDRMVAAGLPVIAGIGLLFTPAATIARLPAWLGLVVGQPLVVSVVLALACVTYLGWRARREPPALASTDRGRAAEQATVELG
jgi:xanthine/uracil permease